MDQNSEPQSDYDKVFSLFKDYIQECIDEEFSLEKIQENMSSEEKVKQISDLKNIVEVIYNNLKGIYSDLPYVVDPPLLFLTKIENFEQKKILIMRLKENKVKDEYSAKMLSDIFKGLSLNTIKQYKKYYEKNKVITVTMENLLPEEKQLCFQKLDSLNYDLLELQNQTLIDKEVLKELQKELLKKKEQIFLSENKDFVDFLEENYNNLERNELDFYNIVKNQEPQLLEMVVQIFKKDLKLYEKLLEKCIHQQSKDFILKNQIEDFRRSYKNGNLKECQKRIQNFSISDPILCLRLLFIIEKDERSEKSKIQGLNHEKINYLEYNHEIIKVNEGQEILNAIIRAFYIESNNISLDNFKKYFDQDRKYDSFKAKPEFKDFINQLKKIYQKDIQTDAKCQEFQVLAQKYSQIKILKEDFQFWMEFLQEQKFYLDLKDTFQNFEMKFEDNQIDQINQIKVYVIKEISNLIGVPIIIHDFQDLNKYYPDVALNILNSIHISFDYQNDEFVILKFIEGQVKSINYDLLNLKIYPKYEQILPKWIKTFADVSGLANFIYNAQIDKYDTQKIEFLEEISIEKKNFEANQNYNNIQNLLEKCLQLNNLSKNFFSEWYQQLKKIEKNKFLCESYEFFLARTHQETQLELMKQIKSKFGNPTKKMTLRNFNKLSGRTDKTEILKLLQIQYELKDPDQYIKYIIELIFSFINRKEKLKNFVEILKEHDKSIQISVRFFVSLILQNSETNLRSRIISYLCAYNSIPMIMQCQISFQSQKKTSKFVPEIALSMSEGVGIFNFGLGKCIYPSGKSQLLNDLLFPTHEINNEAFEQSDKNQFSNNHVDVFFQNCFKIQTKAIIMDGQGNLNEKVIKTCLMLSNIVILNITYQDIQDESSINNIKKQYQLLIQQDHYKKLKVIVIVKDSPSKIIYKNQQQFPQKFSQTISCDRIQFMIMLENMKSKSKNDRLRDLVDLLKLYNEMIEQEQQNPENYKFTQQNYIKSLQEQDKENQDQNLNIIKEVISIKKEFNNEVLKIREDIFQEKGLKELDLKQKIRQKKLEMRRNIILDED